MRHINLLVGIPAKIWKGLLEYGHPGRLTGEENPSGRNMVELTGVTRKLKALGALWLPRKRQILFIL